MGMAFYCGRVDAYASMINNRLGVRGFKEEYE